MSAEHWIDLLERAQHMEQSARRLLHGRAKVKDARADLKLYVDAFEASRLAMAASLEVVAVEAEPESVEPEPERLAFEITP